MDGDGGRSGEKMIEREKLRYALQADPRFLLELLALAYERISHKIRTPLGTALSVLDDCRSGAVLGEQDFADGLDSLKSILSFLDMFKAMSAGETFAPVSTAVLPLLSEVKQSRLAQRVEIDLGGIGGEAALIVDAVLFRHAVECLVFYLSASHICRANRRTEIRFEVNGPGERDGVPGYLSARIETADPLHLAGAATLLELGLLDQSIEALGLIYVEAVTVLHQGKTEVVQGNSRNLECRLYF